MDRFFVLVEEATLENVKSGEWFYDDVEGLTRDINCIHRRKCWTIRKVRLPNKIQNAQGSDTTGDDSSNGAGNKITFKKLMAHAYFIGAVDSRTEGGATQEDFEVWFRNLPPAILKSFDNQKKENKETDLLAEEVLRKHVPQNWWWQEMQNLTYCPKEYVLAAMVEMYSKGKEAK